MDLVVVVASEMKKKKKENQEIEPAGPVFATRLTPVTVIKIKPRL
jgi:hypothetical protein